MQRGRSDVQSYRPGRAGLCRNVNARSPSYSVAARGSVDGLGNFATFSANNVSIIYRIYNRPVRNVLCKHNMFVGGPTESVFTVRRYALHGICDSNSVRPSVRLSVRLSVCYTRGLCPHGSTYDHDFFTIW